MASIYISDVMDQVAATLEVQGWDDQFGPPDVVHQETWLWPGLGETNVQRWTARALILMAGGMSKAPLEGRSGAEPMGGPHTISETGDKPL